MADLWRDFWIRETGTGQQVAQLHDIYMIMIYAFCTGSSCWVKYPSIPISTQSAPHPWNFYEVSVYQIWTVRALAHTPAFCRSRIRLRSWSFSHVPALPQPVVSLILNAARERCLYIQTEVFKTVVRHRQVQTRVQVPMQLHSNW